MKKPWFIVILFLFSCRKETPTDQLRLNDDLRIESAIKTLTQYPTGYALMQKVNSYKNLTGQHIDIYFKDTGQVQTMAITGDMEGSIENTSYGYKVLMHRNLTESETVHVLAHELQHVLDDYEVTQAIKQRPDIDAVARTSIHEMKAGRIHQLNPSWVQYTLGSLFCAETRAYDINRRLIQDGLADAKMSAVTQQMSEHINSVYIQQFGTSYGTNASAMVNWCLGYNSMAEIQNYLITNIN